MGDLGLRATSAVGFFAMMAIAWACSRHRSQVAWRTVAWGVGLQVALAILLLRTPFGTGFFLGVNSVVNRLTAYADTGARFVFGALADTGFSFALNVLPIIIFMGSLFSVLYHLGLVQRVVTALAWVLARTMKLSGAESLSAVANIFVGMIESSLVVKPYLERMTRSELFALMTLGMSTVAGSVLLAYVSMLGSGNYAGHLVTASLLSAPAGLLIAKLIVPETEIPETLSDARVEIPRESVNVIDAAAAGAIAGMRLAAYVGALLIAFVALVALLNGVLGWLGALAGLPQLSLEQILGYVMAPVALLMGVPWQDATQVGALLGVKTVLNEFLAYQQLGQAMEAGLISQRSSVIASYALCGFANFGSLAILLGGIGGIAPSRRSDIAQMGLMSIVAGSLATFMTGCLVGVLL